MDAKITQAIPEAVHVGKLPRNWERAFGYEGNFRFLGVWWEPAGDEAMYSDGLVTADGNWPFFLDLVERRPKLAGYNLGSSEEEPTHCLLLDLKEREIYVAPIGPAQEFLYNQVVDNKVDSSPATPEEWEALYRALDDSVARMIEEWNRQSEAFKPCEHCSMQGWLLAEDGGYDPCQACGGKGLIEVEEGSLEAA